MKKFAKKLAVLLLASAMVLTCAACGGGDDAGNNGGTNVEITDATEILTKTWEAYNAGVSEDMQVPIAGGNMETAVMHAPAKFDLTLETATDELIYSYCIPADAIALVDDAATMMNMMMANNFTSAAYHVADAANVETVTAGIKDATLNNQWMCGFPEKLIVVTVGDNYVVSAFGNGQVIDAFKTAITSVYGDVAVVAVDEVLAE